MAQFQLQIFLLNSGKKKAREGEEKLNYQSSDNQDKLRQVPKR